MDIPHIGYGTWKLTGETGYNATLQALSAGYRHIDTATIYENEQDIGRAISDSGVQRSDLWVTSKLWMTDFGDPRGALMQSLEKLRLTYLDLYLIHRPTTVQEHEKVFDALLMLQQEGYIRHIGVSNFPIEHLQHAISYTENRIFCNQIEMHLFLQQPKLVSFCRRHDIHIVAYCPLSHGFLFSDKHGHKEMLESMASSYDLSLAQLALQYLLQQGFIILPRSQSPHNIQNNISLGSTISDQDMQRLHDLPKHYRYCTPPFAPQRDDH